MLILNLIVNEIRSSDILRNYAGSTLINLKAFKVPRIVFGIAYPSFKCKGALIIYETVS